jgi:hypothetical protein
MDSLNESHHNLRGLKGKYFGATDCPDPEVKSSRYETFYAFALDTEVDHVTRIQ